MILLLHISNLGGLMKIFDEIQKIDLDGKEYWEARELHIKIAVLQAIPKSRTHPTCV